MFYKLRDVFKYRTVLDLSHWRRFFINQTQLKRLGLTIPENTFPPAPDGLDKFATISWAELTGYMRHLLLRDSDQMSMACSLELRVPFLDHKFVEFSLSIPGDKKVYGSYLKQLLIDAYKDLLPTEVYERKKQFIIHSLLQSGLTG